MGKMKSCPTARGLQRSLPCAQPCRQLLHQLGREDRLVKKQVACVSPDRKTIGLWRQDFILPMRPAKHGKMKSCPTARGLQRSPACASHAGNCSISSEGKIGLWKNR